MKKISLKVANMDATEILSKNELKSILGGDGSDGSDGGDGSDGSTVYGDGPGGTYHVTCVCNAPDYNEFEGWYLMNRDLNRDIMYLCRVTGTATCSGNIFLLY